MSWREWRALLRMMLAGRIIDLAMRVAPRDAAGAELMSYIGAWNEAYARRLIRRFPEIAKRAPTNSPQS